MAKYRKKPVVVKQICKNGSFEYDVKDGDVLELANNHVFNLNCCDCGLSHQTKVKISPISLGQKIRIVFIRNSTMSYINRRNKKYTYEKVEDK